MRVLWFTNIPMPAVDARVGRPTLGSGHWMKVLLDALKAQGHTQLAVATAYPGVRDLDFEDDGVRYFTVGQPRFTSQLAGERPADLEACRRVARAFRPEVIHIHGTERFYGLLAARRLVEAPVAISIQGVVHDKAARFFGALSPGQVLRSERLVEVLTRRGLLWGYLECLRSAAREREILRSDAAFLGRTRRDREYLEQVHPGARYFHVGELLRPEFSAGPWRLDACARERVFLTNVGDPRRGLEVMLEAAALLRRHRPGLTLQLAGGLDERSGYGRFVRGRIRRLGLSGAVRLSGFLDGAHLAGELSNAHVYVIASQSENSPNSLCEAMRLGLPCVAADAGGIPSLVEDGATGLLFPVDDARALAARVEAVLSDDALAVRLGAAARAEAARRHDPEAVVEQLLAAYRAVSAGARPRMESST